MKEAIVSKGPKVEIVDSPIPLPGSNEVVIKVVVSGSNPKDWKRAEIGSTMNTGDDIAGVVHAVGSDVVEFKPGDRVAAFHEMMAPHGSFAEYVSIHRAFPTPLFMTVCVERCPLSAYFMVMSCSYPFPLDGEKLTPRSSTGHQ